MAFAFLKKSLRHLENHAGIQQFKFLSYFFSFRNAVFILPHSVFDLFFCLYFFTFFIKFKLLFFLSVLKNSTSYNIHTFPLYLCLSLFSPPSPSVSFPLLYHAGQATYPVAPGKVTTPFKEWAGSQSKEI